MIKTNALIPFLFMACMYSCNQSSSNDSALETSNTKDTDYTIKTGGAKYILVDGKYNVWTKKVGDGKIKVLLLDQLKAYESPEYQGLLMNKLYSQVVCRIPVENWPAPLLVAFKKANNTIYNQMQGVDEFHVTGNFKNWEMWDRLPNIKVPTLVIGGMYDEMNPDDMKREGKLIPNSRTYLCPNGSHLSMYDDQQNYFTHLISFLKDVESNQFTADKK